MHHTAFHLQKRVVYRCFALLLLIGLLFHTVAFPLETEVWDETSTPGLSRKRFRRRRHRRRRQRQFPGGRSHFLLWHGVVLLSHLGLMTVLLVWSGWPQRRPLSWALLSLPVADVLLSLLPLYRPRVLKVRAYPHLIGGMRQFYYLALVALFGAGLSFRGSGGWPLAVGAKVASVAGRPTTARRTPDATGDQSTTEDGRVTETAIRVGDSAVTAAETGLTIVIPRGFWTKRGWQIVIGLLTSLATSEAAWVLAPTLTRNTPSENGQLPPRWRHIRLDGLSWLLFQLLVSPDHPLRKLFEAVDWQEIDARCAAPYRNQRRGAPAYAPQVLFRILILMFYSGTPFESATLRRLQTDVAWRWFVGLSILQPIPDASTLSRFRGRLGVKRFEATLTCLIQACDAAGLIGHLESYFDMTGVEASATQATPYQRAVILAKAVSAYLDEEAGGTKAIAPEQIAAIVLQVLQETHPSLKKVKPAQIVSSQARLDEKLAKTVKGETNWWQRLRKKIAEIRQQTTEKPRATIEHLRNVARELAPTLPQAFGNPDAAVGHTRTDGTLCGYKSGFLVDAKHWIITAVSFIPLNQREAPAVSDALQSHHAIFERYPEKLGLDSAYDFDEVHRDLEEKQIHGVVTVRSRPGPAGVFHSDAFVWNAEGQLICPNGELMEHVAGPYKSGRDRYRSVGDCSQCPRLQQCLTEKQRQREHSRRELQIDTAAHQRAQGNRERSRSPEGRALRRRRFAAEGVFGHTNRYHNGDKAPYRSGPMDHIAQLMVAFVSNLEKLVAYA